MRTLAGASAALILLAGAASLQAVRERTYPPPPARDAALYLRSGEAIRRMSVGYETLAADLYWIRAIQYYGRVRLAAIAPDPSSNAPRPTNLDLLYITTTLDPRFNLAYRFGSTFLADAFPAGAGRPDQAIALLEKGLRAVPDRWQYMQDIGFVHYWWLHDYETAAAWFQRASTVPDAPWWMQSHAAATLAQGGDRESSRRMWEAIRESSEVDWQRQDAERRLSQLRALDEIDELQAGIDRLASSGRVLPRDWDGMLRARLITRLPVDPAGTPYAFDGAQVSLSPSSSLYPPPDEPARVLEAAP
jgi:tetratricopeptide (TPR) repeat protein